MTGVPRPKGARHEVIRGGLSEESKSGGSGGR